MLPLGFENWVNAMAVANGYAALTGYRHEVFRGECTGRWRVIRSTERLQSLAVAEPCS